MIELLVLNKKINQLFKLAAILKMREYVRLSKQQSKNLLKNFFHILKNKYF